MPKNVICLWYDGTAEAAARFYAQTFPNSASEQRDDDGLMSSAGWSVIGQTA